MKPNNCPNCSDPDGEFVEVYYFDETGSVWKCTGCLMVFQIKVFEEPVRA